MFGLQIQGLSLCAERQHKLIKSHFFFLSCLHLFLHPDRKLKKLVRALKDKGSAEKETEEERPPQQWNLDYALAPFEGLTPEYMEMSESAHTHTHTHKTASGKKTKSSNLGPSIHLKRALWYIIGRSYLLR